MGNVYFYTDFYYMNFLAHAHLSGDNEELLFGNFIADAVKGSHYNNYPDEIKKGIILHRKIDSFTDTHPVVRSSLGRVRDRFGKYSGIVVDIFYDHYLAANWANYHPISLEVFAANVYSILQDKYELLPARTKRLLPYLTSQNWLVGYANFIDLKLVFLGMDRRTGHLSGMSQAVDVLQSNYSDLQNDFETYYSLLQDFVNTEIKAMNP